MAIGIKVIIHSKIEPPPHVPQLHQRLVLQRRCFLELSLRKKRQYLSSGPLKGECLSISKTRKQLI
ncbi:hypothetical protein DVH24_010827 [Malus domestica]|uniref:Uncharacterized protein n=1 Tax=Malus domestica TaxID=3750 RepID=A0A498JYE0_MALDO|nr:hypothetical protein DVH24_010827 [Malus domestica]